ncbi:MAG: tetratricopeptide repeat protein [Methanomicrobiales archaeon]|nr:tetratricopeptide repeat protein [Methanomicrobiales archaeon]
MKPVPYFLILILGMLIIQPVFAEDAGEMIDSAGALYSQSVDLANAGKYAEALDAADRALALNVTSLSGLIQSNRAGILVMLDRNEEAVVAADAALAVEGNLTTVHSIAWYNRGNALKNLGRFTEAKDAYEQAYALDNTLLPPAMGIPVPPTNAAQSSLPAGCALIALGIAACALLHGRR